MRHKKVKGGEFVTKVANENVLDREEGKKIINKNISLSHILVVIENASRNSCCFEYFLTALLSVF